MPTAEELLNQVAETGEEPISYLTVDFDAREIYIPPGITNIGVESDDEVKRLWFRIPRHYYEVDLSEFEIRINYTNADGEGDVYKPKDIAIEENYIVFSWLVGRFAFASTGEVKFNLCIIDLKDGMVNRELNTTKASLPVKEGLETLSAIVEKEPDIITQAVEEGVSRALEEFENAIDATIAICDSYIGGEVE